MNISPETIEKLKKSIQTLGLIMPIVTPQMWAWATAKAIEEEKIIRKRRLEELGANEDGSSRSIPSNLSNLPRTISGEQLSSFLQQLSKQSAKYRAKAGRVKKKHRKT